jgi:uncharacterized protein (DUF1501 family)
MDTVTRRLFLKASGVVGATALATGGAAWGLTELLGTAGSDAVDADAEKLVIVTLYGGNDGLNTVVPASDPIYHRLRPGLAYAPEQVLPLDTQLGLSPVLTGLKKVWDEGRLAIVRGVGYPQPDRSHFRSMDIWQTGSPGRPVSTGWVGRWLDGTQARPEAAVSFEPVLPPLLAGAHRTGACVSVSGLQLPAGIGKATISQLGAASPGEPDMQARAATAFRDLLEVEHVVREASAAPASAEPTQLQNAGTATGGQSALGMQLALVARCVEAGVPTRIYSVSLGGFDTHAQELGSQERLLQQLDEALSAFAERMAGTARGRRVTIVVYSEFGRRVHGNSSEGTDHGTAGPMFLLGDRIAGGMYGDQPSLASLDDGDLKASTDFRDVFATLLEGVLGADGPRYLEGYKGKRLPFLKAAA